MDDMTKDELKAKYAAAETFTDKALVWLSNSPYSAGIVLALLVGAGFVGAWLAS